jgi:hypothetical protein
MAGVSKVDAIPTAVELSHSAFPEYKLRDNYAYTVLGITQNSFAYTQYKL